MKIKSIQTKLKLILLTLLCASALNVFAASIDITENTVESNKPYDDSDTTTQAALNVTTGGVTYNGTGITLSATNDGPDVSPIGNGAYTDNAVLSLTGGSVNTTGSNGHGVLLTNAGSGTLNNVNIETAGFHGFGVAAFNSSTLALTGGDIRTTGSWGLGIYFENNSSGILNNVNIQVTGGRSVGVYGTVNSTLVLTGGTIRAGGDIGHGVTLANVSSGTVNDINIETTGPSGYGVYASGSSTLFLSGGTITTSGTTGRGISITNSSTATVDNVNIQTTKYGAHGVVAEIGSTLELTNSNLLATGSNVFGIAASGTSIGTVNLNGNTLSATGAGSDILRIAGSSTLTLTGSNGSLITGNVTSLSNSRMDLTLTGANTELHGNFLQDANAATVINLTLGTGALLEGGGTLDSLTLANGAVIGYTGLLTVTDSIEIGGTVTIDFSNLTETGEYNLLNWTGASVTGDITDLQFTNETAGVEGTFTVANNQLVFNATAVPEPSTYFLIGTGLGLLLLTAYYRRQARTDA